MGLANLVDVRGIVENQLRNLQTSYLDVYYLHAVPKKGKDFAGREETF